MLGGSNERLDRDCPRCHDYGCFTDYGRQRGTLRPGDYTQLLQHSRDGEFQLGSRDFEPNRQSRENRSKTTTAHARAAATSSLYRPDIRGKPAAGTDTDRRLFLVIGVTKGVASATDGRWRQAFVGVT